MTARTPELTAARLLDFEAGHRAHTGRKEEAIITDLGVTPARYYQLLHRVIFTDAAVQHDPILTHRLRDAHTARRATTF